MAGKQKSDTRFFTKKGYFSQIIFILLIVCAVSCINVAMVLISILSNTAEGSLNPYMLLWFAAASCVITLIVAAYHLSTMIRRRKRLNDRADEAPYDPEAA